MVSLVSGALALTAFGCSDDDASSVATGAAATGTGGDGGDGAGMGGTMSTSTSMGGGGQGANGGAGQGGNGAGGAPAYAVCDAPPVGYPPGPYGNELGDTFELLELQGWTHPNPTQRINNETFGAYTLNDLRSEHPSSFVVLHLSGMF